MEERVPGGRKRSITTDDLSSHEDEGSLIPQNNLTPQHRNVSQSLPKFQQDHHINRNDDYIAEPGELNTSYTLDRRKKLGRTSSFRGFMKKLTRHMSHLSLNQQGKSSKSRSSSSASENRIPYGHPDSQGPGANVSYAVDCRIPQFDKNQTPGAQGISNHGNTCFMNAVLQCLSHTERLAEYFVTDEYKHDIKKNNKLNAKKFGTRGELTEQLSILLKSLWSCKYKSGISSEFKSVVGKYGSQYRGTSQHDAQEFLLWLLDKIHEDLNIATKKKYRANKSSHGRSDVSVAQEALANHMRCNNSFVYDLFQALYNSSLTCPMCQRQSHTFDPFLSVSLPIPQKTKRPVYVTVVYLDAQPKQVHIGLLMGQGDLVLDLRNTLAADTNIPAERLLLTEICWDGFHRTFHNEQPLSEVHEADEVYAIETPASWDQSMTTQQQMQTAYIVVVAINKIMGCDGRRFGSPLAVQVPRDISYLDLQNEILHCMTPMLREGIIAQKMGVLFRMRVVEGLAGKTFLPQDVDHPLYMPTIDKALSAHHMGTGPQHIKVVVEWDQQTKQCMVAKGEDQVEEHASVRQVQLAHQQPTIGTLDECFELYTQSELLGGDNAWLCPNCKRRQQGTVKALRLWSLPDTLVIHLKRFKQAGLRRNKLNTLISFPVYGLDMRQHVSKGCVPHYTALSGVSPWQRNRKSSSGPDNYVYDLYAVCNHYGTMQGGHYTAFCKNAADAKWYRFDDSHVAEIDEDAIVTKEAYILFYQRRSLKRSPNESQVWLKEVFNFETIMRPPVSKSHDDLLSERGQSPERSPRKSEAFHRVEAYATLRSAPKPKMSSPTTVTAVSPTPKLVPVSPVVCTDPMPTSPVRVTDLSSPTRPVARDIRFTPNTRRQSRSFDKPPAVPPRNREPNYSSLPRIATRPGTITIHDIHEPEAPVLVPAGAFSEQTSPQTNAEQQNVASPSVLKQLSKSERDLKHWDCTPILQESCV